MDTFTPFASLAGGALIGLAAALLLLLNGRIAGISGIAGGLLAAETGARAWRILFLLGLIAGAVAMSWFGVAARPEIAAGWPLLVSAGVLVGFGTRLGGGCTSGHGVCGLGRLSGRSLVATLTFIVTGVLTVTALRLLGGTS